MLWVREEWLSQPSIHREQPSKFSLIVLWEVFVRGWCLL